jgi:uridine phosphorylase
METFHLLHLASLWRPKSLRRESVIDPSEAPLPSTDMPASPQLSSSPSEAHKMAPWAHDDSARIRAAAAQIVFANRTSRDFITPAEVEAVEFWTGEAVLECLATFEIPTNVRVSPMK